MSLEQMTQYYKFRDLTGQEIVKLVGKEPVLYSDLSKYHNLNELLGKENYAIILYQTSSKTNGHFVAITKGDNGKVRYCDSYGIPNPDQEIQYTPYDKPLPKYLTALLKGTNFEHNPYDFQGKKRVSDCGRWASIFCLLKNFSIQDIHNIFKTNRSGFLSDSDNCAVIITLLSLNNIQKFLSTKVNNGGNF